MDGTTERAIGKIEGTLRYYTYNQNNSGGSFDADRDVRHYVIVEAYSAEDANQRAEQLGLYFDGRGDCPCCGNRWSSQYDDSDGELMPLVYGESIERIDEKLWKKAEVVVYLIDGTRWYGILAGKDSLGRSLCLRDQMEGELAERLKAAHC